MWSIVGPPPFADEARRKLPAHYEEHQQGGNSEAKPFLAEAPPWAADLAEQWYSSGVLQQAREKFEYFYGLEPGSSDSKIIDTRSSLTVAGWADANILSWAEIAAERGARSQVTEV